MVLLKRKIDESDDDEPTQEEVDESNDEDDSDTVTFETDESDSNDNNNNDNNYNKVNNDKHKPISAKGKGKETKEEDDDSNTEEEDNIKTERIKKQKLSTSNSGSGSGSAITKNEKDIKKKTTSTTTTTTSATTNSPSKSSPPTPVKSKEKEKEKTQINSKRKDDTIKKNSGNNSKTQRDEDGLIELPLIGQVNHNQLICDILNEVSIFEKNKGATHKYNAYRKAIQSIRVHPKKLSSGSESQKLDGVGAKIAKKVQEILDTGKLAKLIKLQSDEKLVAINNISRVSGIGPAIAKKLVEEGVTSIEKLRKISTTLNHHQQVGLKYFEDIEQRVPRDEIEKIETICIELLKKIDKDAVAETCGSYRRGAASSGDIDLLLTHPKYNKEWKADAKKNQSFNLIEKLVKALKEKGVIVDDISLGPMKYMGCCIVPNEMDKSKSSQKNPPKPIVRRIDFKLVPIESYYFGLLHNTGSDEFNRQMRAIALSKGYTLSEYSINKILGAGANNKSEDIIVHSERGIFDIIGMKYYAPTQRSFRMLKSIVKSTGSSLFRQNKIQNVGVLSQSFVSIATASAMPTSLQSSTTRLYSIANQYNNQNNRLYASKKAASTDKSATKKKEEAIETPSILTISSYFKYPEYGVNEYVNLSRGSLFLVKTPSGLFSASRPIYAISCAHITHPFNFPFLYKEENHKWIFALGESNIKAEIEYRDPKTGKVLHSLPIEKPYYLHPTLDLVCFRVNLEDFTRSNLPYIPSVLELEDYEHPRKGHTGKLFGYQLVNEKDNIMMPLASEYKFNVEEPNRHFVQTQSASPMGMCGGPAINFDNEVVGMIEGLVKLDPKLIQNSDQDSKKNFFTSLNSNTVYIPSTVLKEFIKSIDDSVTDEQK
ncbi:hypothetical protein PPL_12018 [Heterostelium album PN500]|uniref:DNA-directed DNA polymerase n=1 Tax=Heterostelium pallidum (strain ATCC 26659 / Pp 5 / PN500) TaxID=670386 RepID=D3BV46_HETP5|nr:hypothetical protein PPL_12018 [Heterostelium album PN500]EFA74984.1 hypothetical protein PPL_12018 [Heterostelium album PN500]|eukprot:XP_020427118.1 hypothetical protein PPL_12018 [Heterostelium album PN500]